jgi:XTP/dITP diphosphohydrolase
MNETAEAFLRLTKIMDELREQCPWDKKQTLQSLRHLTIEETYELADAIDEDDLKGIKEELGDLLLHIVFYAKIGTEKNAFTLEEVITGVCDKLVNRHPHIYANTKDIEGLKEVSTEADVKENWEKIKLKEGKTSVLSGVPKSLPSMIKAIRIQEKSKQVGFEWDTTQQVWEKLDEEINELKEATASGDLNHMEDEMGDVLFSMVNLARFLQVNADAALERTNKKFIKRFTLMEAAAKRQGKFLNDLSLMEMDALWNEVKLLP